MEDSISIGIITNCKSGLDLALKLLKRDHRVALCRIGDSISNSDFVRFSHDFSSYNADLVADPSTLINSLPKPRNIIILCKNYRSLFLSEIEPILSPGDTIMDCCDMFYKESARNTAAFKKTGVNYIGTGYVYFTNNAVEKPSFMISGNKEVAEKIQYYLRDISASVGGRSCAAYLGPEGVGQFVKTVATGIYYANLEILSEVIDIIRKKLTLPANDIADILAEFNSGEANSYILDTASTTFGAIDDFTDTFLAEAVLDRVKSSHKDGWIGRSSTEMDCPIPTIMSAIDIHFASQRINERIAASGINDEKTETKIEYSRQKEIIEMCRKGIYLGMMCATAQGFSLLKSASDRYMWNVDMSLAAACLQGGTHLQSDLMLQVIDIFDKSPKIDNLITSAYFSDIIEDYSTDVRTLVCDCISEGLVIPGLSSVINYIDFMRSRRLPTANAQIIRDCVSSVGFERIDRDGVFSGNWDSTDNTVKQTKIL